MRYTITTRYAARKQGVKAKTFIERFPGVKIIAAPNDHLLLVEAEVETINELKKHDGDILNIEPESFYYIQQG